MSIGTITANRQDSPSDARSVYFPNLDGLRFLAAGAVLVHHTEQIKSLFGLPTAWGTSATVGLLGKLGVILFFVLSGFLVTYLLLEEEARTGTIHIRRFYARRALRIWPLYYVIVLAALFVLPLMSCSFLPGYEGSIARQDLALKSLLYLSLFANVAVANGMIVPYAAPGWSIATEEQFYLIWPVLVKYTRRRAPWIVGVIAVYLSIQALLSFDFIHSAPGVGWVRHTWPLFNIDCLAIGGFAGLALHRRWTVLSWLINPAMLYGSLGGIVGLVAAGVVFPALHYEIYALLFALAILNLAAGPARAWSLEVFPLRQLGRISYGLYLWHSLAIVACIRLLGPAASSRDILLYPACGALTIALAAASYRWLESPFLRLKSRFAMVASGIPVGEAAFVRRSILR